MAKSSYRTLALVFSFFLSAVAAQTNTETAGPAWIEPAPPAGEYGNPVDICLGSSLHLRWTVGTGGPYTLSLSASPGHPYEIQWTNDTAWCDWRVDDVAYGLWLLELWEISEGAAIPLEINIMDCDYNDFSSGLSPPSWTALPVTATSTPTLTSITSSPFGSASSAPQLANVANTTTSNNGGGEQFDLGTVLGASIGASGGIIAAIIGACHWRRRRLRRTCAA